MAEWEDGDITQLATLLFFALLIGIGKLCG